MAQQTSIIKTKVLVPGKRRDLLHRERLVDFIHEHIDRKLILIAAAAGYGKTSLLTDYAHDTELPVCWYSLDEWDRDPRVLLEYVVASIRESFPEFGERTLAALREGVLSEGVRPMVATLVNEIYDVIPEHFALVIDDFHLVSDSKEVTSLLTLLIRRLPEHCHILLASRTTTLGLPVIEFVARGEVEGLESDDLRFTAQEIQELLRQNHNLDLPAEESERLAEQSEGWITAILLTTYTLWKGLLQTMARAQGDDSQIFAYLAREVLEQQPREVQDFLIGSSVLQRMNVSLCNQLLDTDNAREMLGLLEDKNLFISRLAGDGQDWFRYHQLFQEFLRSRLRQDAERYSALHMKAGQILEAQESWDEAIRHYLDAQAYDEARRLGEDMASWAFISGRWSSLLFWSDAVIQNGNGSPWMHYWQSKVYTDSGRLDQAMQSLDSARYGFVERDDRSGVIKTALQESYIHRLRADYDQAIAKGQEVLSVLNGAGQEEMRARALRTLGICHGLQGNLEQGLAELEETLRLFESLGEGYEYDVAATIHDIGTIYYLADTDKYLHYSRKALPLWRRLGATGPLAITLNNIGVAEYQRGRYEDALVTLQEALSESEAVGLIRPQAYARATIGDVYRAEGEYAVAQQAYETALALAEEGDEGFLISYLWDALGNVSRMQGHHEEAEEFIAQAIDTAYDHGSDREVGACQISLGILRHVQGRDDEALRLLKQAVSSLRDTGDKQELARGYLHLAAVLFSQQAASEAMLNLELALDILSQGGFDPLVVDESSGSRALLNYALTEAALQGHVDLLTRLRTHTEPSSEETGCAESPGVPEVRLAFTALGSSTVRRDGEVVEPSELRLKAKEMLFFFLAHPAATKDQIVAALWPDESLSDAHGKFHFYLFQLRRLLGGSTTIAYESGAYRLESRRYQYDVEEFHRELAKARRATSAQREKYLAGAISLYDGDYLEDIYSEWTDELRASLRREHHQALEDLARHYREQGRLESAAEFCHKLLDKDTLREDIHRELIGILLEMGDRAGAIRQLKELRRILDEELGADLSDETRDMFGGLLADDE
jgi:LuxR family maltose regulon positive regulatory protein